MYILLIIKLSFRFCLSMIQTVASYNIICVQYTWDIKFILYEMYKQGGNVRLVKHFWSLSWQVQTKFDPVTEVKLQYEVKSEDVYLHGIQMKLNCHMYDVISKKTCPITIKWYWVVVIINLCCFYINRKNLSVQRSIILKTF